jgi:hypothetical protein
MIIYISPNPHKNGETEKSEQHTIENLPPKKEKFSVCIARTPFEGIYRDIKSFEQRAPRCFYRL